MTPELDVQTMHAEKKWGQGRLLQMLVRLYCEVRGHDWREWTYDWPDYDYDREAEFASVMANEFHPGDNEVLLWYRGCRRGCGTIQDAQATLKRRIELPS